MRLAIVGGGIAGALLGYRVRQSAPTVRLDLFPGAPRGGKDASGVSGGLVRGFELDEDAGRLAIDSLTELRGDATLRTWSAYREAGSTYLAPPKVDPTLPVAVVERAFPGSASVLDAAELPVFRGLPAGTTAVVERLAGHISPAGLRTGALHWLADHGVVLDERPILRITAAPGVCLSDGTEVGFDAVVVATGAWTPRLLAASGIGPEGLRTKQIQYSVLDWPVPGPGPFVDDVSGLYGRPLEAGTYLMGLPCDRWDGDPDAITEVPGLPEAVLDGAEQRFGIRGRVLRSATAMDCYHSPPGLALRAVPGRPGVFTFTGGSGGAAKSVLASSRMARATLVGS